MKKAERLMSYQGLKVSAKCLSSDTVLEPSIQQQIDQLIVWAEQVDMRAFENLKR
jgi:hypothetical protein